MFKIVKAELGYNFFTNILYCLFCLVCFPVIWFTVKYEYNRTPLILMIMMVSTLASVFFTEGKTFKEKRLILLKRLPVSNFIIWLSRYLYVFSIWLIISLLFIISYFITNNLTNTDLIIPSFLQFIFVNSILVLLLSFYYIYRDYKSIITFKVSKKMLSIIWIILYITLLLPFFIITNFLGLFGQYTFLQANLLFLSESPVDIFVLIVFVLIFVILSLIVFRRRKSAFES